MIIVHFCCFVASQNVFFDHCKCSLEGYVFFLELSYYVWSYLLL